MRTLLSMTVCYIGVEMSLLRIAQSGVLDSLRAGMAAGATSVLLLFSRPVGLSGYSVATNAGLVTVTVNCLPIVHVSLIVALFGFGMSGPLVRRLVWIVALTAMTLMIEVVRIATVARLLESGTPHLETIHLTVMPVVTLAFVVGCWLFELQNGTRA